MTEKDLIIQDLRRENAELRARVPQWISVKDRLPEFHEDVLMLFDNGNESNMAVGFLCDVYERITSWYAYSGCGWYTDCDESPAYWMPLPMPPKAMRTEVHYNG